MKAFLASAQSSQEDDPELKVWAKQVRDVTYDVEDILDEFMLNSARDHGHGFIREYAFQVEEGELVGIDKSREELIKWLVDGELGLEVVSMGGSGKTTLNILRDIIAQRHGEIQQPVPQALESMSIASLKQILKDFLQQRSYIVVLDDVWNLQALEGIKNALPNNSSCSRIIITTRKADIATVSSHPSKVHSRKPLSPDESWSLFCKKVFRGKPCPPHLEHLSRQILKECEGLPLAIVAIGGLLFAKDVQEWEMITRSLAAELESDGRMKIFGRILSLSYNDLHDNLKSCFLLIPSQVPPTNAGSVPLEVSKFERDANVGLCAACGDNQAHEITESVGVIQSSHFLYPSVLERDFRRGHGSAKITAKTVLCESWRWSEQECNARAGRAKSTKEAGCNGPEERQMLTGL
ncbi:disease resistance protein RPM1-like [Rhodamnia argentea]|uniref:Disease resistance protein RPM1-like n=1 Tax=Rhodamnia argentea TaxID=178133 RepID=A0ABM3HBT5_9MYRT|nr:disease resistance protein RPM1-like [Rhodamnia argentea]